MTDAAPEPAPEDPTLVASFDLDAVLSKYVVKPEASGKPELLLLYSPAGNGKTYLANTASQIPGMGKGLIIDVEGSTKGTLRDFDPEKLDIIEVYKMDPDKQFAFVNTILTHLGDPKTVTKYGYIVIDTFDVLQDLAIKALDTGGDNGYELWGDVKEWSVGVAKMLKRIEPLGILVMHDREEKSEGGALIARLRLSGAAKDLLPGIPDVVAYLERKLDKEDGKVHTFAYFESSNKKVTKNRFDFPPIVRDATLPLLWSYIDKQADGKEKGK